MARCVGRGQSAPLRADDVSALASTLAVRDFALGSVLFRAGEPVPGVWIVRSGRIELSVGTGRRRAVVQLLRTGDVDGDIQQPGSWGCSGLTGGPGRPPAGRGGRGGRVELPQRTLAAMLGVARPSLNRVLKDLERDGLIKIGYSAIEVLDQVKLAARP